MRMIRASSLVVAVTVCVLAASGVAAGHDHGHAQVDTVGYCDGEARAASLRADEARLMARLGHLTTLRGPEDLAALAALGYAVPMHMLASFEGIGTSFARPDAIMDQQVRSGNPGALLYRPNPDLPYTGDPYRPAFPYELAGWGHGVMYTPGAYPRSTDLCIAQEDWFVHEQGVHSALDWGFTAQPPPERYRGESAGEMMPLPMVTPGATHGRFWDIHVWRDPAGGTPVLAMQTPFHHIPGIHGDDSAFFFPAPAPAD
ncbi:hypothetical protein [Nocardia sp. NPDC049149]|uniref:hypothetical protein n=1 Tax=Nocardia sp. NPDC049149 TaxID=3364315 RepID=UPI003720A203